MPDRAIIPSLSALVGGFLAGIMTAVTQTYSPKSAIERAIRNKVAAIITSAARPAPSSHFNAMPSPCSGSAAQ